MITNSTNQSANTGPTPTKIQPDNPVANQRGNFLIIIGVVLLLLIVGASAYYLGKNKSSLLPSNQNTNPAVTSTNNENADWKTYINTKNSYSFSYPSSWLTLSPGGQFGDKCINSTDKDNIIELSQKTLDYCGFVADQLPNPEAEFTIWVLDKPWKDEEILTTDATGKDISEDIVVANEKATKTPFTEKSEYPNTQATRIYFNHNNNGYLIFLKQTDKRGSYPPVYDTILSTIKFTDQVQSDETVNWKMYKNSKVGFSIKYPPTFTKPALPSGVGPDIFYANGEEDNIEVIFNNKPPSYGLTIFPFPGTLDDLFSERKIRYTKSDLHIPVIFPDIPLKLVKTITVSGGTANWYTNGYENGTSNTTNEVHFIGNSHGFIFRSNTEISNLQVMEQILSTFKFTQ